MYVNTILSSAICFVCLFVCWLDCLFWYLIAKHADAPSLILNSFYVIFTTFIYRNIQSKYHRCTLFTETLHNYFHSRTHSTEDIPLNSFHIQHMTCIQVHFTFFLWHLFNYISPSANRIQIHFTFCSSQIHFPPNLKFSFKHISRSVHCINSNTFSHSTHDIYPTAFQKCQSSVSSVTFHIFIALFILDYIQIQKWPVECCITQWTPSIRTILFTYLTNYTKINNQNHRLSRVVTAHCLFILVLEIQHCSYQYKVNRFELSGNDC